MLILGQNFCILGPTIFKIPQNRTDINISQPFQVISSALSVVVQQLLNRASFFDLLAEPQITDYGRPERK
jgi:hypothetical protein